ncbi:glycosyltransferase family 9 protein [Edaphobacter acidisoli]|uniref:glycosyltransferase family 9 protein n=1 Tax=Edaphobacter acidisoli TaxID=2040573 RepID=UPI001E5E1E4D|nr:glycosyltransferase family 9 protein [Edaphobacter acidisoli]
MSPSRVARIESATNFLVLQHATALGTVIHATPLIPALHETVPGCRIAVAASGFGLEVLRNNPGIDSLFETPSPLRDLAGAVRALRAQNPFREAPYVTLTPTGNERTKVALQAVLSGAATRIGFTVVPELYRVPMSFDFSRSQIANNLRIVEALGHAVEHFEPQVFFTAEDAAGARRLLVDSGACLDRPFAVFITQTSVTQRKSWRAERFQQIASFLFEQYGMMPVFVGTAAESDAIEKLRGGLRIHSVNVAGKTNLPGLAALMSLAKVGVSLDTGPLHIARAVGLPTVVIAPAWSPPVEWLPVGDSRFRILKNADMPAATPDYIIDEVSVDDVTGALTDLLQVHPRQTESTART